MKLVIAGLVSILTSQFSLANIECSQFEAQVLGRVQRVEHHRRAENLTCKVYLGFNSMKGDIFNMSQVCPLTIDEAMNYPLIFTDCNEGDFQENQIMTGILVRKPSETILTLE